MPLFDAHGREIPLRAPRARKSRKPKNIPAKFRRASGTVRALKQSQEVELMLLAKHHIGGTDYGPGPVKVPQHVAAVLREGERRAQATDDNFTGTKACMIGPGPTKGALSVRRVAPEYFDTLPVSGVPFGVVDRAGNFASY